MNRKKSWKSIVNHRNFQQHQIIFVRLDRSYSHNSVILFIRSCIFFCVRLSSIIRLSIISLTHAHFIKPKWDLKRWFLSSEKKFVCVLLENGCKLTFIRVFQIHQCIKRTLLFYPCYYYNLLVQHLCPSF